MVHFPMILLEKVEIVWVRMPKVTVRDEKETRTKTIMSSETINGSGVSVLLLERKQHSVVLSEIVCN